MAIQYYMRGYNTNAPGAVGYVDWVVNDTPDSTAIYVPSPYNPLNITNITVNKTVTSKVDNFLKPFESLASIDEIGNDGYFFHLNSYDWLHNTPPGPPIPAPSYLVGLSIVRGSADGIIPRDYASLFWAENALKWLFAYNTNGDGYTIGASLPVGMGSLSVDGYIEVGTNPAQSGIIRIPNNQFIVSRNATNTSDGYLIGQDNIDRLVLGSPPNNQIYIPGNLRVDGYIRDGSVSPSTSGFIRNGNGSNIITFRDISDGYNVNILSTDGITDKIYLGGTLNDGLSYNVGNLKEHLFNINNNPLIYLGNIDGTSYLKFDSASLFPTITQYTRNTGNGQNITLKAQDTTSVGSFGGSTIISSGHGLSADGYVDLRTNNVPKIRVFGNSSALVTADFPNNSSNNINSVQVLTNTIRWYNTITNPSILQDDINTASATGQLMTVQAQNATGTTSIGGALNLSSGHGTSVDGYIRVQTGGTDQIIISPINLPALSFPISTGKVVITGNLEVQGSMTTVDSTVVDIIGRVIHANWSDPTITGNANVPVPSQITGYTIHRGNVAGVPRDSAALMWTEGLLNSGADGYWRAITYLGDGYGADGYTISTGSVSSVSIMANNFAAVSTPNPSIGSLPGIGALRTQNNTTAVSSRNVSGTSDLLLLGTDNSNRIIIGATTSPLNTGIIFNTTLNSVYDFQVNSISNKFIVGDGYVRFGATPSITGNIRNSQTSNINNDIITSRNFTNTFDLKLLGTDGYDRIVHGSAALNKGHIFDTATDGYYDFRVNGTSSAFIDGYKLSFKVGRRRHITAVSNTYQVLATDDYLAVNTSSIYTITLPISPTLGDTYEFKDINGTASINNVTISGNGNNIDGNSTLIINTNFMSFTVTWTGTQWSIS